MLAFAARSIAVGLCLVAATPAGAADTQVLPPLIDIVELWLVANFDLEPAAAPDLVTVAASRLVEMRYGSDSAVSPGEVMGVYDEANRTIFLTEGWNGRTPDQLSVLVHEMVHHLQVSADMRFACPAEREVLAYRAQDAWLRLFGMDLESALGIDTATLLVATVCTH